MMEEHTSSTNASSNIYQDMESVTTSLPPTILRQVAKQRLPTSKSRIFFRKQSMRWEWYRRTSYPMHSGHTRQHKRPQLECPHTNWCTGPFKVINSSSHGAITLQNDEGKLFKVNGQRLKLFLEPKKELEEIDVIHFYLPIEN